MTYLGVGLFGIHLVGTLWFLNLDICFFRFGKFLAIISSFFFLTLFYLLLLWILVCLILSQRSLILILKKILFLLFWLGDFQFSTFQATYVFFCITYVLLIPSRVFSISVILLFSSNWFFMFSSCLLTILRSYILFPDSESTNYKCFEKTNALNSLGGKLSLCHLSLLFFFFFNFMGV